MAYLHRVLGDSDLLVSESLQAAEAALVSAVGGVGFSTWTFGELLAGATSVPVLIDGATVIGSALFSEGGGKAITKDEFKEFARLLLANRTKSCT
jgi:hypothetical protein